MIEGFEVVYDVVMEFGVLGVGISGSGLFVFVFVGSMESVCCCGDVMKVVFVKN